jgi:DHA2 family methylenomycin A resistance protein-like MFS transporter
VFASGTVVAAVASSEVSLVAARLIQGLGAAAMFTLSLAIASNAFPPERQATAVGIWAAISSLAMGIGPLLGGILVDGPGWRWIFWTYLPFLAAAAIIIRLSAADNRDETAPRTIDVRGLICVSLGLALVVLALVESDSWGISALTLTVFAAGIALLVLFLAIERRVRNPLVDLSLFRNRPYFGATIAALAIVGSYWTVIFFQPQYLQGPLGYSVTAAGLLVLPITLPLVFISPFTGRWMARIGPRRMLAGCLAFATLSMAGMIAATGSGGYAALFAPYLGFGVALALLYAPVSSAAMAAMPRDKAGIAAGVMGMLRLLAGALLLAVSGAVFQATDGSDGIPAGAFQAALVAPLLLLAAATLLSWKMLPAEHRHEPEVGHHRLHF